MRARDPENRTATTRVRVSEFLGPRGSFNLLEECVDERTLTVDFARADSVGELIAVNPSQDVLAEIARCLNARGFWRNDARGRRHLAVAIDLSGTPGLDPGRYTFGSRSITVRSPSGRLLRGGAIGGLG